MDLGLQGSRALVTGGSKGIGRAIALMLAEEGCDVAVCARGEAAVAETVGDIEARGVRARGRALDVTDTPALTGWIGDVAGDFGGLDIVIANVSALAGGAEVTDWQQGFDIDVMATVHTVEAARPHLLASPQGAIVAIASVSAAEATHVRAYTSHKAALIAYVSGLSRELAGAGVRANTVSPGTIYFEGGVWQQREQQAPEQYRQALARNPTGRMGTPEEVASAAVFLASPRAGFVSGANMVVDGALTVRIQY